ncbi:hypothetical protein HDU85_002482 [Gaertneriomyces sp. JEL0708]|nr:hypothetical protein HDU85_002482 [Gaertneriomyces sp. JEL0708]
MFLNAITFVIWCCILSWANAAEPILSIVQLNYTGYADGSANVLSFQAKSDEYFLTYKMLSYVAGRKFHVAIVHQSFSSIARVSPEDFYVPNEDDDIFSVSVKFPYAGVYVMQAHFTVHVDNLPANITLRPIESTMYLEVQNGQRLDPPPRDHSQIVTGMVPGSSDSLAEPWIYPERVVSLPKEGEESSSWDTGGTFYTSLSPGSGPIKLELCRTFIIEYYTVDSTGNTSKVEQFEKLWDADAQVDVFRHDFLYPSTHTMGYRLASNDTWKSTCLPREDAPVASPNNTRTNKIGFGFYFAKPGMYQAFIQAKLNGYVVTNSYSIEVKDPSDLRGSAQPKPIVAARHIVNFWLFLASLLWWI